MGLLHERDTVIVFRFLDEQDRIMLRQARQQCCGRWNTKSQRRWLKTTIVGMTNSSGGSLANLLRVAGAACASRPPLRPLATVFEAPVT
jgi:hypothetical protein